MTREWSLLALLAAMGSSAFAQVNVAVCDILVNLGHYSGKMVRVSARIEGGAGAWLAPPASCPLKIRVANHDFQNLIAIAWPDSPAVQLRGPKVAFDTDKVSSKSLEQALASPGSKTQDLYGEIEGLIVTRQPPLALIGRNGAPIGFGHLGIAPAQIIVKQISNLRFRAKERDARK